MHTARGTYLVAGAVLEAAADDAAAEVAAGAAEDTAGAAEDAGAGAAAPPPPMVKSTQLSYVWLTSAAFHHHWRAHTPAVPHWELTSGTVTEKAVLFAGMVCAVLA